MGERERRTRQGRKKSEHESVSGHQRPFLFLKFNFFFGQGGVFFILGFKNVLSMPDPVLRPAEPRRTVKKEKGGPTENEHSKVER